MQISENRLIAPKIKMRPWRNGEMLQKALGNYGVDLEECIGVFDSPAE